MESSWDLNAGFALKSKARDDCMTQVLSELGLVADEQAERVSKPVLCHCMDC